MFDVCLVYAACAFRQFLLEPYAVKSAQKFIKHPVLLNRTLCVHTIDLMALNNSMRF